jgi:hypothetical protein
MTAFPKADVQVVRIGIDLNVRFWPKAAVREKLISTSTHTLDA